MHDTNDRITAVRKRSILKLLWIWVLVIPAPADAFAQAQFVWMDAEGSGRQQKVLFRRSFDLADPVEEAKIHLFAASRYHIHVNGTHLNFGPPRFYPENPEYDSYDLAPWLKRGRNVIAVEVLRNGTETFQVPLTGGAFMAWGEVRTGGGVILLVTPGQWKMMPSPVFDPDALRFSFACGPMEITDARREPAGWKEPGFDDTGWGAAVPLRDQGTWGMLAPRTIPHLTQDELLPLELLGMYEDAGDEEVYTFLVKTPDETNSLYGSGYRVYACTHIHSPVDQQVEAGLWWGEHYLNGEGPLEVSGGDPFNPVRQNRILELRKGWNFFFVDFVAIWGGWDFYMALPGEADLVLSPEKSMGGGPFMFTAGPFPRDTLVFDPETDDPGNAEAILGDGRFGWVPQLPARHGPNPARDLVWHRPDISRNLRPNDHQVTGLVIERPVTLVFDLGGNRLGRIFCEAEGGDGAVIDIGWSEDLDPNGLPFLYKRLQVNAAARFITADGHNRYETFKPYGARYLRIRIDPGQSPLVLKRTGVAEQVYPFEKRGSFSCSNPMLDRIWEMGWRTLRVCSEDSYTDTPFRERGLYAGDALPEYAITLATSGDSRLMKRSLMLFQDMYRENMLDGKKEGLNDFVLITLLQLHWYFRITGDTLFLRQLYPNYHSLMQHILDGRTAEGIFASGRVFIEWTRIDKSASLTAFQALLARSFAVMSELAGELGRERESERYAVEARLLTEAINRLFWDPDKGAYRDGMKEGRLIDHHYPISSAMPLLFDLCDPAQEEAILRTLDRELADIGEETRNRKITPYGSFYLFSALYRKGDAALAERFLVQYWSRMIHQGDDTSWENFDIGGEGGGGQGTASHAWSGHPTFFLSTQVLGVQLGFVSDPDPAVIRIRPQSATLTRARGTVPHPAGEVTVDWHIRGGKLVMHVTVPPGTQTTVQPRGRLAELELELKIEESFEQLLNPDDGLNRHLYGPGQLNKPPKRIR